MKRSLHIGINDYPGTGSDLSGCVNDANDWREALEQRGFQATTLLDDGTTFCCIVTNDFGTVTSDQAVLNVQTVISVISDDFYSSTFNESTWTFIDPLGDATLIMTGTQASITVPAGTSHDVWTSGNNAPRIMQSVSNMDFEIEVKFESQLTSEYQMQGVIVQQDDSNYLRFDFIRGTTGSRGAT